MVVVDIAPLLAGANLAAAETEGLLRRLVPHEPHRLIEAMDVLLDVVITGKPGEIEPVAHLVFHFRPLGLAAAVPERTGEVVLLNGDDLADHPILNLLHRFANAVVVPPAKAGDKVK